MRCGMGILPMCRRAILALQSAFILGAALVKRTGKMPVPLLTHAYAVLTPQWRVITLKTPHWASGSP